MKYYSTIKETIYWYTYNMAEGQKCYAKWEKPETKRTILYDSIWNVKKMQIYRAITQISICVALEVWTGINRTWAQGESGMIKMFFSEIRWWLYKSLQIYWKSLNCTLKNEIEFYAMKIIPQ